MGKAGRIAAPQAKHEGARSLDSPVLFPLARYISARRAGASAPAICSYPRAARILCGFPTVSRSDANMADEEPAVARDFTALLAQGGNVGFDCLSGIDQRLVYRFALREASWQRRHLCPVASLFRGMDEHRIVHSYLLRREKHSGGCPPHRLVGSPTWYADKSAPTDSNAGKHPVGAALFTLSVHPERSRREVEGLPPAAVAGSSNAEGRADRKRSLRYPIFSSSALGLERRAFSISWAERPAPWATLV